MGSHPSGAPAPPLRHWHRWVVFALIAGLAARVYGIGHSLNMDEVFSVRAASGSLSYLIEAAIADRVHPPLYYLLLHFWLKVAGTSEVGIRLLSVATFVPFLLFLGAIATKIARGWAAVFIIVFCAVNGSLAYYTQGARAYPLVALFAVMSIWSLLKTQEEGSGRVHRALYGVACAGLMYSQYFGAVFLLAQFAVVLVAPLRYRREVLISGCLGALSVLPWLLFVAGKTSLAPSVFIAGYASNAPPSWLDAWQLFVPVFGWMPVARSTSVLGVLLLCALVPLVTRQRRAEWRITGLVIATAAIPPTALFFVSAYGPFSVWLLRPLIPSLVMAVCLLALALGRHRPVAGGVLGGALLAWTLVTFPASSRPNVDAPWRDVARVLQETCAECTVIVPDLMTMVGVTYYSHQTVRPWERRLTVADAPDLPFWIPGYREQDDELPRAQSAQLLLLCRPSRCGALAALEDTHDVALQRELVWGLEGWPMDVRLLARRSTAGGRDGQPGPGAARGGSAP